MRHRFIVRAAKIAAGTLVGVTLLCAVATGVGTVLLGWANPPVGRFIDTASGKQHVLDVGPDDAAAPPAPPVVLLHGATANLGDMRVALVERLRARHRVIAIDRPGHGWSERIGGEANAAPRRQAAAAHEILGKLGVERPVMLAHSWGGAVGLAYALEYPGALRGLVLLAPLARPWENELLRYAELANTPWLGALYGHTFAMPIGLLGLDRILTLAFAPQAPADNYVEGASILLALRPGTFTANAQDLAYMGAPIAAVVPQYARIATPTVIITGTDDHLVSPRSQARPIARQLPHARLIVLPGIGHMLHHVEPKRVVDAIESLAGPDARAGDAPSAGGQP